MPAQKITVRPQTHSKSVTYLTLTRERVYRTKISDVDELKRRINSEWAGLSHAVTELCCWRVASASIVRLRSCWRRTFWAHAVIKMIVMWHVWLF